MSSAVWFHDGAAWGGVRDIGEEFGKVMVENKLDLQLIFEGGLAYGRPKTLRLLYLRCSVTSLPRIFPPDILGPQVMAASPTARTPPHCRVLLRRREGI